MGSTRITEESKYKIAQEVYKHLKEQWPVSAKALVEGPDV